MKKAMIAMSGGVDSSAALLLLKDRFQLMGVTLKLFDTDEEKKGACCSLSDIEDARAVASRFGIPHYVYNFKERFQKQVIDRFVSAYVRGETPNPCIACNRYIKFEAMLERAKELGCDYLATGHYARVEYSEERGRWLLKKATYQDGTNSKDQSYVLYDLTQEQLSHMLFPLGEMKKEEVRSLAAMHGLVNSSKPDSQDICFVMDSYGDFIRQYTGKDFPKGDFLDQQGNVVGEHSGIIDYTIGQRRGLRLAMGTPVYVTDKDARSNTVTIGTNEDLFSSRLVAHDLNWIAIPDLQEEIYVKAKTRYSQTEQPCHVTPLGDGKVEVIFDQPQRAITKGQSIVFYDGDIIVGGGIIS